MKKILFLLLCISILASCSSPAGLFSSTTEYRSRFDSITEITLSDEGISVNGGPETASVCTSRDIIYYEDRDTYDSGSPYGAGAKTDRHSAEEAEKHTVVNITAPGAYRVSGKLSAGQIRIDLGKYAFYDPAAVVELILSDADITCTVAPAILFLNTYECDNAWTAGGAQPYVDTAAAGANLILEGANRVDGAHVARIFKDKKPNKKLWKQDGAIYSYMSMNVFGPGNLDLTATYEGLNTELHLTINGGNILIKSQDDGINVNEDRVSVVTINGGNLMFYPGLMGEGDGIDTNGYLVINDGTVIASAHPALDTGFDSDYGTFVHGGFLASYGCPMAWVESKSRQTTLHLQFSSEQKACSRVSVTRPDGTEVCSVALEGEYAHPFTALILSSPDLIQGEAYRIWVDGVPMAGLSVHQPGEIDGVWTVPPGWGFSETLFAPDTGDLHRDFQLNETVNFISGLTPA